MILKNYDKLNTEQRRKINVLINTPNFTREQIEKAINGMLSNN